MIGQTVSHYRVVEQLGEGGMGVVYRAEDLRLRRTVALKFLHPRSLEDPTLKRRLLREAQAAAALDHPNICTVFEIDEAGSGLFIAMAFVEGPTLKELIRRGPLPVARALSLGRQIAEGLSAAHEKGIVHLDIKPANVIVTPQDQAKITDFGLARVGGSEEITITTDVAGTTAYMSPERLRAGAADPRTDLWSWGVVFYEMLAGRLPFAGQHAAEMIYAIVNEAPRPLPPVVSQPLARIVERALAKVPDQRYASASELLDELQHPERAARTGPSPPSGKPASIAVLPFADLSPAKDQQYFCDGIAEEVINDLGQVDGLRVVSRTSSFAFKQKQDDVRRIGRELGVLSVLEGSVRKAGDRLRIATQLIDVNDGCSIWAGRFDRKLADVFAIQEEIAHAITAALQLRLSARARDELAKPAARDVESYELYLRGRRYFYRTTRVNVDAALSLFRRATETDPRYALAWAGMADCHSYLHMYFKPCPENMRAAEETSCRALALAPGSAEAHASRGLAASLGGDFDLAAREFRTAIRLNPNHFEGYYFAARTCFLQGKFAEAISVLEQAARVSPEDYLARSLQGLNYKALGNHDEALASYRRALRSVERHVEWNPDDTRALYLNAQCLIELGQTERGLELADRIRRSCADDPYTTYGLACAYAGAGRIEDALDCLESAMSSGFAQTEWTRRDPDLVPLHDHPRFAEILGEDRP